MKNFLLLLLPLCSIMGCIIRVRDSPRDNRFEGPPAPERGREGRQRDECLELKEPLLLKSAFTTDLLRLDMDMIRVCNK